MEKALTDYVTKQAFDQMTDKQRVSLDRVLARNCKVLSPFDLLVGDNCIIGQIEYLETGLSIWLGIETDGYTHS